MRCPDRTRPTFGQRPDRRRTGRPPSRSTVTPSPGHPESPASPRHRASSRSAVISSMYGDANQVLHQVGAGERRCQLQVGGQPEGSVPPVRNEPDAVLLRHPADPAFLADAPDLRHVRLDDVECPTPPATAGTPAAGSASRRRRSAGARRAGGPRNRPARRARAAPRTRRCRSGPASPPCGAPTSARSARRHRWPRHRPSGGHPDRPPRAPLARSPRPVAAIDPAERSPAHLDRPEPVPQHLVQHRHQPVRLVHQDRGVGLDPLAVAPAEETPDRLARSPGRACPTRRCRSR